MLAKRISNVLIALALCAFAAQAQTLAQIGSCPFDKDLVQPFEIKAQKGAVNTTLRVELKERPVPVWINTANFGDPPNWQCSMQKMKLRLFGYPTPDGFVYGFPGPTLRLRKAPTPNSLGDGIKIKLVNGMPKGPNDVCDNSVQAICDCSGSTKPQCCTAQDVAPNCFHGDNDTNLHFHGTHVSPQAPQDYVLLELRPKGSDTSGHPAHAGGIIASGQYQYSVNPLRYTQSEGTHWYHSHKHGSTAIQVAGGMAGALLIEGAFDDWLKAFYKKQGGLKEKVMVVQVIHDLNFVSTNPLGPQPLVNGQPSPKVKMRPGEIQRWRLVGATMEGAAQLRIDFNGPKNDPLVAKQIAMDGIQFAPENYGRQPLLDQGLQQFFLSPGNRADFLVQAPTVPGIYRITYDVFGHIEGEGPDVDRVRRQKVRDLLAALVPEGDEPRLLTVEVVQCPTCKAMKFPSQGDWPAMPPYLSDIKKVDKSEKVEFILQGKNAFQPNHFMLQVNDNAPTQFCSSCVNFTLPLGTAEEWAIHSNKENPGNKPFHVFHIHTNPFQLITNGKTTYQPPYIWQDSITLPSASQGSVVIRQKFEEFTGQYVLHCHFLGHEDRGMMLSVQTVCPEKQDSYGKPRLKGSECFAGNYIPAVPMCTAPAPQCTATQPSSGASSGQ
ncbi:MAG TPA: multicopper oxidase domain-containing protein [Thermoanaerobaculia bacterium]|nr:multicopper oxidase domain-containing protein [Thermoanaerobaculia bacterium]